MSLYKADYCEQLKVHCENGKSLESFCAVLRLSPKIIESWYKDHPDFKDAVDMAPCLELLYWEMTMARSLLNKDKESINIAKSKLDNLSKYVISPLKKNTYSDLRELNINKSSASSGDLVKDFNLLHDSK